MHLFSHQHRGLDARVNARALVADARDRRRQYLRRVPRVPVLGRARTRAAVRLHRDRPRGGRLDDALPAAAAGPGHAAAMPPTSAAARPPLARDRAPAAAALARRRCGFALHRRTWLSPRPLWENDLGGTDAGAPRADRARLGTAPANWARPTCATCSSSRAATHSPSWAKRRGAGPAIAGARPRGALGGFDHPARYLPTKSVQDGGVPPCPLR